MAKDLITDLIIDAVDDVISGKGGDILFANVETDEGANVLTDEGGLVLLG